LYHVGRTAPALKHLIGFHRYGEIHYRTDEVTLSEKLCIFDGSRHPEWPFLPQFNTSEHLIAAR
jgi:hypothetical protein